MKCTVHWVAWVLVIIGAINWGLVGAFEFDLVDKLFGGTIIATIVYLLVGIAGIALIFDSKCTWCKQCCEVKPAQPMPMK